MHTRQERNAGSSCIFGNIAGVQNKITCKYHLSDYFDISSICGLITVTGDLPNESLLEKQEAAEVCVHVYM